MKYTDELHEIILEYFDADRDSNSAYGTMSNRDRQPYVRALLKSQERLKQWVRATIDRWLTRTLMAGCHTRVEFTVTGPYRLWGAKTKVPHVSLGYVSIFSDVGSLGKAKWLNKITVNSNDGSVVSHVARTDQRFLGVEKAEKFGVFVLGMLREVNKFMASVWDGYDQE